MEIKTIHKSGTRYAIATKQKQFFPKIHVQFNDVQLIPPNYPKNVGVVQKKHVNFNYQLLSEHKSEIFIIKIV